MKTFEEFTGDFNFADALRADTIDEFMDDVKEDSEYNVEEPNERDLLDPYDGYDKQTYIQNNLDVDGTIIFYEGWSDDCWRVIYRQKEYKFKTKEWVLQSFLEDRMPRIAASVNMDIVDSLYYWGESWDDWVKDGWIMKIILRPKEVIINESYSSRMFLIRHYLDLISSDITKIMIKHGFNEKDIDTFKSAAKGEYSISIKNSIGCKNRDIKYEDVGMCHIIEKCLNSWRDKLIKNDSGFILSYKYGEELYNYLIVLRDYRTQRVNPNRYVYHCSPIMNRESIRKNGLELRRSTDSFEWSGALNLAYPPSIFATNNNEERIWDSRQDLWRIDTMGLGNKWYYDLNFPYSKYKDDSDSMNPIMTFEPIPAKHLKLINGGRI
jgi:hypothetical protein